MATTDKIPVPFPALEAAIARVHGFKLEHVVQINSLGEPVWKGTGGYTSVSSPSRPDVVVIHNHPGQARARFSFRDVSNTLSTNLIGVVAVGDETWCGLFRLHGRFRHTPMAQQMMKAWDDDPSLPPVMPVLANFLEAVYIERPVSLDIEPLDI